MLITTRFPRSKGYIEISVSDGTSESKEFMDKEEAQEFKDQLLSVIADLDRVVEFNTKEVQ